MLLNWSEWRDSNPRGHFCLRAPNAVGYQATGYTLNLYYWYTYINIIMTKHITKTELEELYIKKELSPYQISDELKCNHKTIRAYLKKYNIPMRTAQEYNYLAKKSHTSPSIKSLQSNLSIMGHIMYLCEGWHTNSTNMLSFCNQDISIIKIFIRCLNEIYHCKTVNVSITYNKSDKLSVDKAEELSQFFDSISLINDSSRKNPIITVRSGGKNLSREFIANAYQILNT